MTETQKSDLLDFLVTASCEDTNFLENRLYELVEANGTALYEEWMAE
jgi:hypothetical protein